MELRTEYAIQFRRELPGGQESGYWTELDTHGDGHVLTFDGLLSAVKAAIAAHEQSPYLGTDYRIVKRQISDWEVV